MRASSIERVFGFDRNQEHAFRLAVLKIGRAHPEWRSLSNEDKNAKLMRYLTVTDALPPLFDLNGADEEDAASAVCAVLEQGYPRDETRRADTATVSEYVLGRSTQPSMCGHATFHTALTNRSVSETGSIRRPAPNVSSGPFILPCVQRDDGAWQQVSAKVDMREMLDSEGEPSWDILWEELDILDEFKGGRLVYLQDDPLPVRSQAAWRTALLEARRHGLNDVKVANRINNTALTRGQKRPGDDLEGEAGTYRRNRGPGHGVTQYEETAPFPLEGSPSNFRGSQEARVAAVNPTMAFDSPGDSTRFTHTGPGWMGELRWLMPWVTEEHIRSGQAIEFTRWGLNPAFTLHPSQAYAVVWMMYQENNHARGGILSDYNGCGKKRIMLVMLFATHLLLKNRGNVVAQWEDKEGSGGIATGSEPRHLPPNAAQGPCPQVQNVPCWCDPRNRAGNARRHPFPDLGTTIIFTLEHDLQLWHEELTFMMNDCRLGANQPQFAFHAPQFSANNQFGPLSQNKVIDSSISLDWSDKETDIIRNWHSNEKKPMPEYEASIEGAYKSTRGHKVVPRYSSSVFIFTTTTNYHDHVKQAFIQTWSVKGLGKPYDLQQFKRCALFVGRVVVDDYHAQPNRDLLYGRVQELYATRSKSYDLSTTKQNIMLVWGISGTPRAANPTDVIDFSLHAGPPSKWLEATGKWAPLKDLVCNVSLGQLRKAYSDIRRRVGDGAPRGGLVTEYDAVLKELKACEELLVMRRRPGQKWCEFQDFAGRLPLRDLNVHSCRVQQPERDSINAAEMTSPATSHTGNPDDPSAICQRVRVVANTGLTVEACRDVADNLTHDEACSLARRSGKLGYMTNWIQGNIKNQKRMDGKPRKVVIAVVDTTTLQMWTKVLKGLFGQRSVIDLDMNILTAAPGKLSEFSQNDEAWILITQKAGILDAWDLTRANSLVFAEPTKMTEIIRVLGRMRRLNQPELQVYCLILYNSCCATERDMVKRWSLRSEHLLTTADVQQPGQESENPIVAIEDAANTGTTEDFEDVVTLVSE
ncbi:hypothetical protein NX059_012231 [Plenodomus lindquistii]|nr:hypothetical protein NX059_012231 [Plenodomus lindquistii]